MTTTAVAETGLDLVIQGRYELADGVICLLLGRRDGTALPAWQPGAHIDVILPSGRVRQYSLTGDGDDPRIWEIAVLRESAGRGGSEEISQQLDVGSAISVGGPRNHFVLDPAARYRFVAGGIGITPIRAMLPVVESLGAKWQLLYGGRSAGTMAYASELQERYGDRVLVRPQDKFGLLDLDGFLGNPAADTLIYCCGPSPLLAAVEHQAQAWPAGSLRVERFAPVQRDPDAQDSEFEVELAQTGVTVVVPADRSILSVAEEAGAFVTAGCEEGTCGSCETPVLSGLVDHRDSVLTAEQRAHGNTMMICVSRCRGNRLVLDV
ncbi:PDR/VanB family oxidoreductase [Streptomyces sp. NPDC004629]|uniref:PDR/VanB family oxidoreductase n=1 Tax=Streptomyces sp. NPDC004629 TaxID=3364705 RepID=UPI0036C0554B